MNDAVVAAVTKLGLAAGTPLGAAAREVAQPSALLLPPGGDVTMSSATGLLVALGLAMLGGGMWWMFRAVTPSTGAPLPTTTRSNRSGTPVNQITLQRPQLPKERSKAAGQSRELTPYRQQPIATHHAAFMQLYYALEARRTSAMPLVIHFASPSPHAGVSTVTSGYARVAADAGQGTVLFIDASGHQNPADGYSNTPTLAETFANNGLLASAIVPARNTRNLLWSRLYQNPDALLNLGMDRLHALLDMLRAQHSLVVLDCSCAMSPQAAAVSRYCDGSVLVVAAGKTSQLEIDAARRRIEHLGGQVVGIVLNRERGRALQAEFA